MGITQEEADLLIGLPKRFESDKPIALGNVSLDYTRKLLSIDRREIFFLDVWRGSLNLKKYKLQNRARSVEILVRVDIQGSPHKNPDGAVILCPHIHIYKEGYNDKWAYPLSEHPFRDPKNIIITFEDFAEFCNIVEYPDVQGKLI